MRNPCIVDGCQKPNAASGYCDTHYRRWKKHGDPHHAIRPGTHPRPPAEERFWAKVNKDGAVPMRRPDLGPCWEWTASRDDKGYGQFNPAGSPKKAYRFAYEFLVGPVPEGLELDHLCFNRGCVNPGHLEAVTHAENVRRSDGPSATHSRQTHCIHGHPLDDANTYEWRGMRYCRKCRRDRNRNAQRPTDTAF